VQLAGTVVRIRPRAAGVDRRPPAWFDCDTPEDLAQAQRWARRSHQD
jgi:NDP-sugar pyrophosphorylase family protein